MRPQLKVVLLVAVVLVATLSAVVWKTQGLLLEDKLRFINDSALKQIAPLKRLISEKLESAKIGLVQFATSRESQGAGHTNAFGSFDVVALLEPTPPSQTSQWSPTWIEKGPNARAEKWPAGYDVTLLKSLPYAKVKDGQALWVRLSDSQGTPLYAVLVSVEVQSTSGAAGGSSSAPAPAPVTGSPLPEATTTAFAAPASGDFASAPSSSGASSSGPRRAVVVGFASENPLAPITEDYIGSINTVFILDDRGYVASHIDKAYLGSLFSEDSIAKEVMKGQKASDTGEYDDMDGRKVLGHFERVDNTNLSVVITTPMSAATAIAEEALRNTILVGGSVGLLSLIVAWLVGSALAGPVMIQPLKDRADMMTDLGDVSSMTSAEESSRETEKDQQSLSVLPPSALGAISGALPVSADRLKEERKYAFQAFHSSLAARLREPLLAVIGHVQLVKTKTNDQAVLAHADSIEREARLAKDSIEHWQILEEAPTLSDPNEKLDLEKVALSALADKSIELEGSGIEIVSEMDSVPPVKGNAKELEMALENMIENSIEAMRDQPRRRLTMKLTMVENSARLSLEDTGIGMTREVREKAFEPFFKGFEAPRHMGLGLAFVQNTLKKSGATCEIESTVGEGARFILKFPVEAVVKTASVSAPVTASVSATAPSPVAQPLTENGTETDTAAATVTAAASTPSPFKLGGKEPLPLDVASVLPPFPGKPLAEPLMSKSPSVSMASEAGLAHDDQDDDDEDDKFSSVSFSAPVSHRTDHVATSDEPDDETGGIPENTGTEWQVKIRRPKPKGQS